MSRSLLAAGPKVVLYVNGTPMRACSGFTFSSDTPRGERYGLDSGQPYELTPGPTRAGGTINVYRLIGDGGAQGMGIVAQFSDLPRAKYLSLALVERHSGIILYRADRCSIVHEQWSAPAKGLMTGTIQFKSLDWSNEASN